MIMYIYIFTMRKCIEGLVTRAAIIYRVHWLICSPRFRRLGGGRGVGFGPYVGGGGGFGEKEGEKKGCH